MTKVIYPAVAREYGSTAARVERSSRHAVEVVGTRGDQDQLSQLFACTRRRHGPTNAEFIAVLADSLREPAMQVQGER